MNNVKYALVLLLAVFMVQACKQPETVVITDDPVTPGTKAPERQDTARAPTAAFMQLNVGEVDRIPTLDPLFAENTGTMRAVQLMYEGLVRYDRNRSLVPAVAKNWSVQNDSLTYRFTLRTGLFYHDSSVFSAGTGRKLVAGDIKFVFERMARNTVPPRAAKLFKNIRGFEPFFLEQHEVLFPPHRQLQGVEGIQVRNDSTIAFHLKKKDPRFLHKLATPFAVIYPREAVGDNSFTPVGTGPFKLSQRRADSLYIFGRFDHYHGAGQPRLNRIDVRIFSNETNLFKAFATGEIHFIPEMGPHTLAGTLDSAGTLNPNYTGQFELLQPGGAFSYRLMANPASGVTAGLKQRLAGLLESHPPFGEVPLVRVSSIWSDSAAQTGAQADSVNSAPRAQALQISYTDDPYMQYLIQQLSRAGRQAGLSFAINPLRIPVEEVALYSSYHTALYPGDTAGQTAHTLVEFRAPHLALQKPAIKNMNLNRFAWWIDYRDAALPGSI